MRNLILSVAIFFAANINAAELATSGTVSGSAPHQGISLPKCVNSEAEISNIQAIISANSSTEHKYDGYRKSLSSDSPEELVARLAYAETLAANCPANNKEIASRIVNVIANRARGCDPAKVVFHRNQFASSLNKYSASRYRDFLCPRDQNLWTLVYAEARQALHGHSSAGLPPNAVQYYLYQHDPSFSVPTWAKGSGLLPNEKFAGCIRFFPGSYGCPR